MDSLVERLRLLFCHLSVAVYPGSPYAPPREDHACERHEPGCPVSPVDLVPFSLSYSRSLTGQKCGSVWYREDCRSRKPRHHGLHLEFQPIFRVGRSRNCRLHDLPRSPDAAAPVSQEHRQERVLLSAADTAGGRLRVAPVRLQANEADATTPASEHPTVEGGR